MFHSPQQLPNKTLIEYETDIGGGDINVSNAYELALFKGDDQNFELQLGMRLSFIFEDNGLDKWRFEDKRTFIDLWDRTVKHIWDGLCVKSLNNNKLVKLSIAFDYHSRVMLNWEVTVKKRAREAGFRSYVAPGSNQVALSDYANEISVRGVRNVGNFQQITSAHEFGHMIGLADEYGSLFGGSDGPYSQDYNSVMNIGSKVRQRHVNHILRWLNDTLAKHNIK